MHITRGRRPTILAAAASALLGLALLSAPVPAEAQTLDGEHWSESGDDIIALCGLDVRFQYESSGRVVLVLHGDGLPYWHENFAFDGSWTNTATGLTMRQAIRFHNQDQKIVDNGDGTLTITEKATGPLKAFGSDSKLMFVDTSVLLWTITVDDAGTPADPSDDVVLEESDFFKDVGNQGLDGRDFCADLIGEIG